MDQGRLRTPQRSVDVFIAETTYSWRGKHAGPRHSGCAVYPYGDMMSCRTISSNFHHTLSSGSSSFIRFLLMLASVEMESLHHLEGVISTRRTMMNTPLSWERFGRFLHCLFGSWSIIPRVSIFIFRTKLHELQDLSVAHLPHVMVSPYTSLG